MRNDIRHFVRYNSKCQLIAKSREIKKDVMHLSNTWVDRSNSFKRWDLDFIDSLSITNKSNKWIVINIDYSTR